MDKDRDKVKVKECEAVLSALLGEHRLRGSVRISWLEGVGWVGRLVERVEGIVVLRGVRLRILGDRRLGDGEIVLIVFLAAYALCVSI